MDDVEARRCIAEQVKVDPLKVLIAQAYVVKHFVKSTQQLISEFLRSVDAELPQTIVFPQEMSDATNRLEAVAESISWCLACGEAIWKLIHSNVILPLAAAEYDIVVHVSYSTGYVNSRTEKAWDFNEFLLKVPGKLMFAPSLCSSEYAAISDPDIYLKELDAGNISAEIEADLRESVLCFQKELYLACLAMLGKASEMAWIELGVVLGRAVLSTRKGELDKKIEMLLGPHAGIGKKIQETLKLYEHPHLPGEVRSRSGVSVQDLRSSAIWADTVRDSRNSLHYGAQSAMTNCYEKVGTLLISAVPNLRMLCNLKAACMSMNERQEASAD